MILSLVDSKNACFDGNTWSYKNLIKVIPGARWEKGSRRWEIPIESVQDAKRVIPSLKLSEAVEARFRELETRSKKAVAVKSADLKTLPTAVKGLKGNLRPYQAKGKAFLDVLQLGEGSILGFDMGLGKSLTSLATFLDMKNKGLVDYCLVICPSPLKFATWEKEIKKWTDLEYIVVDGDKTETVEWDDGTQEKMTGRRLREIQYLQWQFGAHVTVMNYELFLYDSEADEWKKIRELTEAESKEYHALAASINVNEGRIEKSDKGYTKASKEMVKKLIAKGEKPKDYKIYGKKKLFLAKRNVLPNILPPVDGRWCVILDECQRVKAAKAQTTKAIFEAIKHAGRKIPCSGTPLENNIQELWSIVDLCRPGMLGNYFKFVDRYCEKDYWGSIVGPKVGMLQELRDKIEPIMIRITKEEALPDLPELIIQDYWVSMTPEQKKLYNTVREGIIENLTTGEFSYLETLAQLTRLQQLLDSPRLLKEVLGDDNLPVESGKLQELKNVITDIMPKKFIIFSQYKEMTDILYEWLTAQQLLCREQIGYIHGGMKATATARIQDGFQNGDIQCVLMTTAGNYGIELSAASYVLCYDELFNPQKMQQIYSRAHRSGVKSAVTAINFVTRGTYEENKVRILEGKKELFKAVIDSDDTAFASILSKEDFIAML